MANTEQRNMTSFKRTKMTRSHQTKVQKYQAATQLSTMHMLPKQFQVPAAPVSFYSVPADLNKLAPRIEDAPARCRDKIAKSTDGPLWAIFLARGG